MSSQYTSEYPKDIPFDAAYKRFFEEFYKMSDTPDANDKYPQFFTKDAVLIMASKRVEGSQEILALRKSMWEKVSARSHKPLKVFPLGANADEVMLYGTVEYVLKDGRQSGVDWAARACLVKEGEDVKMRFYQVYLDTAAQVAAK
ncbi:hypothetical protein K490DRAFT_70916 [Saccharata proteae CBS 121410]|uniref:SnoaL-like domain-containing protein n=1 Tax=Saccharata proteae CBS 121410 TaxID=1314787 RepID=A0A9P4I2J2_9PEZI|nr:hypothetical protein K490DRAFT_70916 [Saccharata proteae CBS 121410]